MAGTPAPTLAGVGSEVVTPWTRRVFLAGVVAQLGIVVTGGLVRLTGSGLGCPSWPQCTPGSYVPVARQPQGFHKDIEFGNRALTFVLTAVVLSCLVAALRHRTAGGQRRLGLVSLAAAQVLGILAQALLGGITVLTHLNPVPVAAHFLLSMLLVGLAVLLHVRSGEGDGPARALVRPEIRSAGYVLLLLAGAVLTAGTVVTGSGPHAGDVQAQRFGLDPEAVSQLHADLVFLYVGVAGAIMLALRVTDAAWRAGVAARWVLAVALGQGVVGYVQYFTGLPVGVVTLHLLGACLIVVTTVRLVLSLRERPDGPAAPGPTTEQVRGGRRLSTTR